MPLSVTQGNYSPPDAARGRLDIPTGLRCAVHLTLTERTPNGMENWTFEERSLVSLVLRERAALMEQSTSAYEQDDSRRLYRLADQLMAGFE